MVNLCDTVCGPAGDSGGHVAAAVVVAEATAEAEGAWTEAVVVADAVASGGDTEAMATGQDHGGELMKSVFFCCIA